MAYNALNNLIDAYIYANGVQAITGQILNGVLKQMVSQLGSGYHLMGVAGPETVPASNDYAMAYFAATAGEYADFGGITLAAGEVAVLLTSGNGSWSKQTIYTVPTDTADLENTAGFITNAVTDLVNYYTKTEVDDTLANYPTLEALATALADYYTKTEIDTILAGYTTNTALASALADYYNKNDIDGLLSVVNAALADRYTKSETDTKLGDYYKKTETYDKDEVDSIVAALSRQEYIVAWDGLAAPDVSAIPAGVTVTYSGTPYTGTLAASASTVNKIYMVWNGVAYDMYGTSQDGGYSWVPMGTTSVNLSQYATKAELSQLQQELYGDFELFDVVESGTSTGTDRYLATWADINKVAGDRIDLVTEGVRPAQLTIYEYTTGNSTLLPVTEIDNTHGYIQTLEGAPFTGINFIGVTSGQKVYIVTGNRGSGLVENVDSLQNEVADLDLRMEGAEGNIADIDEKLDGSYAEFNAKDGTSTGEDRYLVVWSEISKAAGDRIDLVTSGVRPSQLVIYEYTNANSTLLPVTEIDETHGYIQTLEGPPFTGINFIGLTQNIDVYVVTGEKAGGLIDTVSDLDTEVFGGPKILEVVGDGTQKFVSWEDLGKAAGDLIEFETEGVLPSTLNIYEYTTGNSTLLPVTEISSTKGSVQTLEGSAFTGINFINLANGKKVRFVVGQEDGLREMVESISPYYGKNAITLGDSHSQNRAKWLPFVCEKLGMKYLSALNNQINVGNFVPAEYEVAENPLLAQVRALKDNIGDNSVDVVFLENTHYEFKDYNNAEETIRAYPFKPTQLITLRTFNGTRAEEQADFETNSATLLAGIPQSSRMKKTLMKSICSGTTRKMTFSADSISDGLLTITIDGESFSTQVSSSMSLARVVMEVSTWQFGDNTNWRNVDRGVDSITFLYTGEGEASMTFSYDDGGTGITLTMGDNEQYSDATYRYFASTDLSKWTDIAYWETFRNYWYNGFAKWKGVIEELQAFLPNAEIIIMSLASYRLNSVDEDFDMDGLSSNPEYIKTKTTKDAVKEVASLYGCTFLDIWETCGISPFNWFTFYPADTVHPNDDGYMRWAETIVKELG